VRALQRRRDLSRLVRSGLAVVLAVALVSGWVYRMQHAVISLHAQGVVVEPDGGRRVIPAQSRVSLVPGARVLQPDVDLGHGVPDRSDVVAEQQGWLAAGSVPAQGTPVAGMVRDALLDLHVLTLDNGATVAGWSDNWHYVWPRDASFVAAAYARTGHTDDAVRLLMFLQSVQHSDGLFEARYRPNGIGPPDSRGIQLDGTGWVLWAAGQVAAALPDAAARARLMAELRPMIDRSTIAAIAAIDNPRALPRPSRDYWETRVHGVTLGTVAPLLAGLRSAAVLYSDAGRPDVAARAGAAAVRLDAAITRHFGPAAYPREIGGDDPDTAVAFLLPPFAPRVRADVLAAWRDAGQRLRRPGGGLAPGAGWRDDGVSWTAETAIFAMAAAASGQQAAAEGWLNWLNAHRTRMGALPEQVTSSGRPASVAPLAWTDAAVVLAAATLDSRGILVDGP
jgi:hypothetical protein